MDVHVSHKAMQILPRRRQVSKEGIISGGKHMSHHYATIPDRYTVRKDGVAVVLAQMLIKNLDDPPGIGQGRSSCAPPDLTRTPLDLPVPGS